ncbi:MAG: haloacid dehalogenase type II [Pseudomonadota bacterium]
MTLQAAMFDVFGTVVDWRSGVSREVARVFAAHRIEDDATAVADAWRGEYQPAMARIREGDRGYIALDILHRENLDRVLAARGHAGRLDEAALADLNRAWERLPPWPDSVAGIAAMQARLFVAPCSNGSIALMARLARFAGLSWDAILGADVARAYKPQPEAYLRSAAALGVAPGAMLMVAAHNDDLAVARALGFATAFVPRPTEHGPGQTTDLAPSEDWDLVATDLVDLAQQLDGNAA